MDVRGVVAGMVIGGVLVMGIASGQGGGAAGPSATPAPPPVWQETKMKASSRSSLVTRGFCRRGYEVRQLGGWQSVHYRCRPA